MAPPGTYERPAGGVIHNDFLQVEGQVRRPGGVRGEAAEGTGGRERAAEADAGGHDAGQRRAEGSAGKKVVTPAARREATTYLRQAFEMSERRACRVIGPIGRACAIGACDRPTMHYAID